jgi:hypothetical protein
MIKLNKEQVKYIKKQYLTKPSQKTYCKKFEQYGGNITFLVEGVKYVLSYNATGAYTDYIEFGETYNSGIMHKGNNVRSMDKHHKFNHSEYKLHNKIDNKFEVLHGGRFNPKDFQK